MSCAFILSRQLEAHVRACVCVDSWWTVQGSGETLGEDSNTHTHTLTRIHSHTLIIPAHTRNTHLEAEDAPEDAQRSLIICASSFFFSSSLNSRRKKKVSRQRGRGEERSVARVWARKDKQALLEIIQFSCLDLTFFLKLRVLLSCCGISSFAGFSFSFFIFFAQIDTPGFVLINSQVKGEKEEEKLDQGGPKGAKNSPGRHN